MNTKHRHRLLWLAGGYGLMFPLEILRAKAAVLENMGQWDTAIAVYENCLFRLGEFGNESARQQCFSDKSHVLMLQSRYEEAEKLAQQALEMSIRRKDMAGKAKALNILGNIANSQGYFNKAAEHYQKALSVDGSSTDMADLCVLLKNLGVAYYELGNYTDSIACQKKALSYAEAAGRLSETGAIYLNLGIIFQRQQKYQPALDYLGRALAILHRIGLLHLETNVHNYFGIIYSDLGNTDQALHHYQIVLKYSRELNDQQGLATAYNNLGNIHLNRGNYQKAAEHFNECLLLCRSMQHETGIAVASFNLGEISKELGDLAQADRLFSKTIDYARKQNARYLLCQFLAGYADLGMRQGRNRESAEMAEEAISLAGELNLNRVVRSCRLLLARMEASHTLTTALSQMEKLLAECDDENDRAEINYRIFKLTGNRSHRQTALECYRRLDTDPENRLIKNKISELEQTL